MTDAPVADMEAERGLIQTLLAWPESISRLPKSFRPHFAWDPANRATLDEIFTIHRSGATADVVLLLPRLRIRSAFSNIDLTEYLTEVARPGPLPTNAAEYAHTIERLAHKRRLAQIADEAAGHFRNGVDPRAGLMDLQAELDSYSRSLECNEVTGETILDETFASIVNRDVAASIDFGWSSCNLSRVPIRRGAVITVGGQAGSGKTAAMLQGVFDAMRMPHQADLKFFCLNVEMPPGMIIERQLARVAGVDCTAIQRRTFHDNQLAGLEAACEALRPVLRRTRFATGPFTISRMLTQVQEFSPDMLLCDYLQRIGAEGEKLDLRAQINRTMDALRLIASDNVAVVAISALNRPSGGGDWTKDSVSLASFRESSEVEYSSDAVYALVRDRASRAATLVALKNRSGPIEDIELEFEGPYQRFVSPAPNFYAEFADEQ
ncbi:DnaB-like helicase C-terminal domain-containing protein [Lacipirellula sp.]|uniref:DnaB-like helicase C-terminal domain-containing protein n=1 Tax=Lacipirellula sp. TaxID=2691419 RepID=UPI003D0F2DA7